MGYSTPKTLGESRVRTSFNPSADSKVDIIKQRAAELIDIINEYECPEHCENPSEFRRLQALAMTHVEDAAMWGVKALTI